MDLTVLIPLDAEETILAALYVSHVSRGGDQGLTVVRYPFVQSAMTPLPMTRSE
jgi:hypothetical protein